MSIANLVVGVGKAYASLITAAENDCSLPEKKVKVNKISEMKIFIPYEIMINAKTKILPASTTIGYNFHCPRSPLFYCSCTHL